MNIENPNINDSCYPAVIRRPCRLSLWLLEIFMSTRNACIMISKGELFCTKITFWFWQFEKCSGNFVVLLPLSPIVSPLPKSTGHSCGGSSSSSSTTTTTTTTATSSSSSNSSSNSSSSRSSNNFIPNRTQQYNIACMSNKINSGVIIYRCVSLVVTR